MEENKIDSRHQNISELVLIVNNHFYTWISERICLGKERCRRVINRF